MRIGKAGEPDLTAGAVPWGPGMLRVLHRGEEGGTCVLGYGPIMALALDAARADGRITVLSATSLQPLDDDVLGRVLALYSKIIILEEAAGAPLAGRLRALAHSLGDPVMISSLVLPREFPHSCGTHEELLAAAGLSVEKILAAAAGDFD